MASGVDQWEGPLGVISGCGHWMLYVGGGYTFYLIMKYPFSCVCAFEQPRPYFLFHSCKLFFILYAI